MSRSPLLYRAGGLFSTERYSEAVVTKATTEAPKVLEAAKNLGKENLKAKRAKEILDLIQKSGLSTTKITSLTGLTTVAGFKVGDVSLDDISDAELQAITTQLTELLVLSETTRSRVAADALKVKLQLSEEAKKVTEPSSLKGLNELHDAMDEVATTDVTKAKEISKVAAAVFDIRATADTIIAALGLTTESAKHSGVEEALLTLSAGKYGDLAQRTKTALDALAKFDASLAGKDSGILSVLIVANEEATEDRIKCIKAIIDKISEGIDLSARDDALAAADLPGVTDITQINAALKKNFSLAVDDKLDGLKAALKALYGAKAEIDSLADTAITDTSVITHLATAEKSNSRAVVSAISLKGSKKEVIKELGLAEVENDKKQVDAIQAAGALADETSKTILAKALIQARVGDKVATAQITALTKDSLESAVALDAVFQEATTKDELTEVCTAFANVGTSNDTEVTEKLKLLAAREALTKLYGSTDYATEIAAITDLSNDPSFVTTGVTEFDTANSVVEKVPQIASIIQQIAAGAPQTAFEIEAAKTAIQPHLVTTPTTASDLSEFRTLELQSLGYESVNGYPAVMEELRTATVTTTTTASATEQNVITFSYLEDATKFAKIVNRAGLESRGNKWRDVAATTASSPPTFQVTITGPITDLVKTLETLQKKDAQNSDQQAKRDAERRQDRTTKQIIAGALNFTAGIPIIPAACYALGRATAAANEVLAEVPIVGAATSPVLTTVARALLGTAKVGFENPNIISFKDKEGQTRWPFKNFRSAEESLNQVDSLEKAIIEQRRVGQTLDKAIRGTIGLVVGVGAASVVNGTSAIINYVGDGLINGGQRIADQSKEIRRSSNWLVGGLARTIGATVSTALQVAGAPIRAVGMVVRSTGSLLSQTATVIKENDNTYGLGWIGNLARKAENELTFKRRGLFKEEDKKPAPFAPKHHVNTGADYIDKASWDIIKEHFEKIKSPDFVRSGIKDDPREYVKIMSGIARYTDDKGNHAPDFQILYCPQDGTVSITTGFGTSSNVEPNKWPAGYGKIVEKLINGTKGKEAGTSHTVSDDLRKGESSITIESGGAGLSYSEFKIMQKQNLSDPIRFVLDGKPYEARGKTGGIGIELYNVEGREVELNDRETFIVFDKLATKQKSFTDSETIGKAVDKAGKFAKVVRTALGVRPDPSPESPTARQLLETARDKNISTAYR